MAFAFSFSGDDIDPTSDTEQQLATQTITDDLRETTISSPPALHSIAPKRHTLSSFLQDLPDQISYNNLVIDPIAPDQRSSQAGSKHADGNDGRISVPRRALFDIYQQLMTEADPTTTTKSSADGDSVNDLLSGIQDNDLSKGIYEGGFKTWECAVDLAGMMINYDYNAGRFRHSGSASGDVEPQAEEFHIIELGAGSSMPSLVLLQLMLYARAGFCGDPQQSRIRFTLCDYNVDVLRLCTAVNIFLGVHFARLAAEPFEIEEEAARVVEAANSSDDLDLENINEDMVNEVMQRLEKANVEIEFVSGSWGEDFLELLNVRQGQGGNARVLVLASETIYSPDSIMQFTTTTLDILRTLGPGKGHAFVAAKKVYFGVGGGVQEFEQELKRQGGRSEVVLDIAQGVGRRIMEVGIS